MAEELTQKQLNLFKRRLQAYKKDPLLYASEILGNKDYAPYQKQIFHSVVNHQRTTVRSGHGLGKSYVSADICLWFLYNFYPSIVITTSSSWRQVEKILWAEIREHHMRAKFPLEGRVLETEIKISPKWYAIGFASDKKDNFMGFHEANVLVVVDEPSGVEDEIFESIEGILTNENARLLLIGNPIRDIGYFANSFKSPIFNKLHISCYDSPNVLQKKIIYPGLVTEKWIKEREIEWGKDSPIFKARVLGEFPKETDDTLIPLSWVENSIQRYKENSHRTHTGYVCTAVDVARYGQDWTVFMTRCGNRIVDIQSYRGFDLMHTVKVAQEKIKDYQPTDFMVDDNGIGGGVTDRLKELGYTNIVPINNGERAEDSARFLNRRAELSWRVREAFRQNLIEIPDNKTLMFECSNLYYDQNEKELLRVMSKSMMKKKGLKSPNHFDALMMLYARSYTGLNRTLNLQYLDEFYDFIHVRKIPVKNFYVGVTRYMTLISDVNGYSYGLWYIADRSGRIYFEHEEVWTRASSSAIVEKINAIEKDHPYPVNLRYTLKKYLTPDKKQRYTFLEQLEDDGIFFDEVEWDDTLAGFNIREGLRYDKDLPLDAFNCPYLFFNPDCTYAIRSIKNFMNPNFAENDALAEIVHEAVGISVLAEPTWVKKENV